MFLKTDNYLALKVITLLVVVIWVATCKRLGAPFQILHLKYTKDKFQIRIEKYNPEYKSFNKWECNSYQTRSEGINLTSLRFVHPTTQVWITWEIKVLNEDGGRSSWELEVDGGGRFNEHVGFLEDAINVVLQYDLLISHFFHLWFAC